MYGEFFYRYKITGKMNTVLINRQPKTPGEFTQVNYNLLYNKELTSNQKIILMIILSMKDGYSFTKDYIREKSSLSKNTFIREWRDLLHKGYIESIHKGNRQWKLTINEESNGPKMDL